MAKQSKHDRLKRLNEGRCPIHGLWMPQEDTWHKDEVGEYTHVACPRTDCDVVAKTRSIEGPWSLVDDKAFLLDQGSDGTANVLDFPKRN